MINVPRNVLDKDDDAPLIPAGRALVEILSVRHEDDDDKPCLHARYRVLAHVQPAAAGMHYTERFLLTPGALPRLTCLLKRCGIQERGDPADEAAQFDPEDLVGQQVVADLEHNEIPRKRGEGSYTVCQWTWGSTWAPSDQRVADFVRSLRTRSTPGRQQQTAPPQQPTPPPTNGRQTAAATPAIDPEV